MVSFATTKSPRRSPFRRATWVPWCFPGTGRMVWWTGRVAIGLRHEAPRRSEAMSRSALWLQDLMLQARAA